MSVPARGRRASIAWRLSRSSTTPFSLRKVFIVSCDGISSLKYSAPRKWRMSFDLLFHPFGLKMNWWLSGHVARWPGISNVCGIYGKIPCCSAVRGAHSPCLSTSSFHVARGNGVFSLILIRLLIALIFGVLNSHCSHSQMAILNSMTASLSAGNSFKRSPKC